MTHLSSYLYRPSKSAFATYLKCTCCFWLQAANRGWTLKNWRSRKVSTKTRLGSRRPMYGFLIGNWWKRLAAETVQGVLECAASLGVRQPSSWHDFPPCCTSVQPRNGFRLENLLPQQPEMQNVHSLEYLETSHCKAPVPFALSLVLLHPEHELGRSPIVTTPQPSDIRPPQSPAQLANLLEANPPQSQQPLWLLDHIVCMIDPIQWPLAVQDIFHANKSLESTSAWLFRRILLQGSAGQIHRRSQLEHDMQMQYHDVLVQPNFPWLQGGWRSQTKVFLRNYLAQPLIQNCKRDSREKKVPALWPDRNAGKPKIESL